MKRKPRHQIGAVILTLIMVLTMSNFAFADMNDGQVAEPQAATAAEAVSETETEPAAEPALEEEPLEEPILEQEPEKEETPIVTEEPQAEPAEEEASVPEESSEEKSATVETTTAQEISSPSNTDYEEPAVKAVPSNKAVTVPAETEPATATSEKALKEGKKESAKAASEGKVASPAASPEKATAAMADVEFDNSTKLLDGEYASDEVTLIWEGGTGKVSFDFKKLIVQNGKAYATFTTSSPSVTHLYLAHTASGDEDKTVYDPSTGKKANGVYEFVNQTVTIPVRVNEAVNVACRTTVMSAPHWVQYTYKLTVEEPEPFKYDNSTTLKDGLYKSNAFDFTFEGGTDALHLDLESISVKGGKATGVFVASSPQMTHVYPGTAKGTGEIVNLFNPANKRLGPGVASVREKRVTVPIKIDQKTALAARNTAETNPKWTQYQYKVTMKADAESEFDNTTTLKDGTYNVSTFKFTGGTGKATMTCTKVTVKDGKATAIFTSSSDKMTHLYLGRVASDKEDPALFDPATKAKGKNVYAFNTKNHTVTIPVALNQKIEVAARTTAMSEPHWVNYTYKITVTDQETPAVTPPADKDKDTDKDKDKDKDKQEQTKTPTKKQKLKDGTYKVLTTTDRKMFYIYPKEQDPAYSILTVKDGKMTATITLTGEGYDYVYMGTPAEAKKAGKKNWIKAKIVNGYYTFTIPVAKLDKKLTITPHSHKYEEDGDPSTDPWRPDKWVKFYSGDAVKIKGGATSTVDKAKKKTTGKSKKSNGKSSGATSGKQTKFKNDNKKDKVSKWQDDSSHSTAVVNASTTLKDGVYTPDSFSWSGGSGRLAYIRCNKITVTGGQAYATIEFGSSSYDSLRANGRVYSKSGGGNSTFVIPVKLNANNTIIGRTTAMSQPHWIEYTIYIGKAESAADAAKAKEAKKEAAEAKMKISDKAPEITGLKAAKEEKEDTKQYAKYFKIFNYEDGVKLLSIDISKNTELQKAYTANAEKAMEDSKSGGDVEYDEDGNVIAKSQNEYVEALYKNNVINYLLVPEDYEVPAGLDKEYIIVRVPSKKTVMASPEAVEMLKDLKCLDAVSLLVMDEKDISSKTLKKAVKDDKVKQAGTIKKPDFKAVVKDKSNLVILPGDLLPAKIKKDAKDKDKLKEEAKTKKAELEKLESRFTTLNVPVIVDRSAQEKDELAQAEWIKVYGALYGCEDEAEKIFEELVKEAEE